MNARLNDILMKKIFIIISLAVVACTPTRQGKAEATIKKHLHLSSDSSRNLKFTKLDSTCTIGLINGVKTPAGPGGIRMVKTLWFQMDPTCSKILAEFVN